MAKPTPIEIQIEQLTPYKNNARKHSDKQIDMIAKSLRKYGFLNPVLINDKNMILAGHGRVEAAKRIGLKIVPCVQISHLTPDEQKEYILADNRLAELAEWDNDMLSDELKSLSIDFNDIGFDKSFLRSQKQALTDEDKVPPVPVEARSRIGDIWVLGEHRLAVNDATDIAAVSDLMDGQEADLVWTDPPYNVAIQGAAGSIMNDDMSDADFMEFLGKVYNNYYTAMRPGACIYVAHADSERVAFTQQYLNAGLKLSEVLIWVKQTATLSRQDYNWKHEPILYGWKEGAGHYFAGDFTLTTVIDREQEPEKMGKAELLAFVKEIKACMKTTVQRYDRPSRSDLHPTMKPVGMIRDHIEASSKHNEIVLDFFGGSGSTLMAAETAGRKAYLMELDPRYADVIIKRWQDYTGLKAIKTTGELFDGEQ